MLRLSWASLPCPLSPLRLMLILEPAVAIAGPTIQRWSRGPMARTSVSQRAAVFRLPKRRLFLGLGPLRARHYLVEVALPCQVIQIFGWVDVFFVFCADVMAHYVWPRDCLDLLLDIDIL